MLVSTTFRITELKYTYGCPTLVEACLLSVLSESVGYTKLIGVQSQVQRIIVRSTYKNYCITVLMDAPPKIFPLFVSSTYRITKLHYTYGYATLSAAYVGYL